MDSELRYADVVEGVRAAIAAYTLALDAGRTDDIVATFCDDGGCDIQFLGAHQGHDALRVAFDAVKPVLPQRHLVLNTLVTDWNQHEATALSDIVFLIRGDAGWSVALVGQYRDTLHNDGGDAWRFHHRACEFVV